jgi:hypothetical protein
MFVEAAATARFSLTDLRAAVDSIDDTFNTPASALTQGQTVVQNINARLPEPFKGNATLAEKALAVAFVAMKTGGLI